MTSDKTLGKNDKVKHWVWSRFINPARKDTLLLTHWQREEDVHKDYEYAQLNKKINIVDFTKEEYDEYLSVKL
jgi:DNA methyltransferase 1-associated protein 1